MTQSRFRTLFRRALVFTPAYAFLWQTCPEDDSFNFKSEMRCVLQGKYLPSFHSDKPKNVFEEAAAMANAALITEILDSGPKKNYHVDVIPLLPGAVKLALVEIKSFDEKKSMLFFWLGFAGGWIWIYGDRKALSG